MAKIVRYNGNLVAPASAALGTERTLFGSVTQANDLTSQFTAELLRGWGIVGPSDQPTLQDFNAMAYTMGQLHAYLHQMGVAEWNAGQEYHIGSLATVDGLLFSSRTNNNTGNDPSTNSTNWQPEGAGSTSVAMTGSNVTLTPLQAARSVIIITGVLTANVQLIFPTYVKSWQIVNATTGNFSVTCKTAAGTGVVVSSAQGIVGDGVNIYSPTANNMVSGIVGTSRGARGRIAAASASFIYTANELIVGNSLGGKQYRLSNISLNINLATTGAGGMDTGLAPINGYVALYVIYNPATDVMAMLAKDATSVAATQVYSGANMPAGFTASALVSVVPTDASRLMKQHILNNRTLDFASVIVLSSSTQQGTPATLAISTAVPLNAIDCSGILNITSTASSSIAMNVFADGAMSGQQGVALNGTITAGTLGITGAFTDIQIRPDAPQTILYTATASAGTMAANIYISRYKF